MARMINTIDFDSFNSNNLYIDFSQSTQGHLKISTPPVLNIILKDGSTIVDTISAPLGSDAAHTRLFLTNPTEVENFFDVNIGFFDQVDLDISGIDMDTQQGLNLILAELVYNSEIVLGSSFSTYKNSISGFDN